MWAAQRVQWWRWEWATDRARAKSGGWRPPPPLETPPPLHTATQRNTSHHITSHHITSHHITSHHIKSHTYTPTHNPHTVHFKQRAEARAIAPRTTACSPSAAAAIRMPQRMQVRVAPVPCPTTA